VTAFTTVVYGDIKPKTQIEIGFSSIWILIGMGLFYFLLSQITSFLSKVNALQVSIDNKTEELELLV
jgi:hypothetical protein